MTNDSWLSVLSSQNFWSGVIASILAAAIVGICLFIFRNSLRTFRGQRERGRKEDEIFESALRRSDRYAPFAFGVVQGRALRYFLTAVFIAYLGDIIQILYPFNSLIYAVALYYVYRGLKWFYRIEHRALEIIGRSQADDGISR